MDKFQDLIIFQNPWNSNPKITNQRTKRQGIDLKKILANIISNKRILSGICEDSQVSALKGNEKAQPEGIHRPALHHHEEQAHGGEMGEEESRMAHVLW